MPISKGHKAKRAAQKQSKKGSRIPLQPDGMPQGRHLTGFKGTKTDAVCLCAGCHPNALEGRKKVIYK
jgi:hypothetical protein